MLDLDEFTDKKRALFHTTPTSNLEAIRKSRCLRSARALIVQARGTYVPGRPREEMVIFTMADGTKVTIRDQEPLLRKGQLALEPGFTMEDLVEMLDSHVFLWTAEKKGLAESPKYANESRALLIIPTAELLRGSSEEVLFSRVNAGGPRATGGKPSVRGRRTLLHAGAFKGSVSDVKEVAFHEQVLLPASTQVRLHGSTSFVSLFAT